MARLPGYRRRPDLPSVAFAPFILIAFGLAWGLLGVYIAYPEEVVRLVGPLSGQQPLFVLAVYSPAIAAAFVILFSHGARLLAVPDPVDAVALLRGLACHAAFRHSADLCAGRGRQGHACEL